MSLKIYLENFVYLDKPCGVDKTIKTPKFESGPEEVKLCSAHIYLGKLKDAGRL